MNSQEINCSYRAIDFMITIIVRKAKHVAMELGIEQTDKR